MERINGYLDLTSILNVKKSDDIDEFLAYLKENNSSVKVVKFCSKHDEVIAYLKENDSSVKKVNFYSGQSDIFENSIDQFVFSFEYNGLTYYFKFDSLSNSLNELICYYISKDMGLDSVFYDLAIVGGFTGNLSKDYKVKNAKYISGEEIINSVDKMVDAYKYNNLRGIWHCLEVYFKDYPNMQEIVAKLMMKIVKLFIFDLITGQEDRHEENWGVVIYENGDVDLQPIFDNSRSLEDDPEFVYYGLSLEGNSISENDKMIQEFLSVSSSEFSDILPNYLWVIGEENINKIFKLIEEQINCEIPPNIKRYYINVFSINYNFFKNLLDDLKTRK